MSLSTALSASGIIAPEIIVNGQLQRCGTLKKPKGKNGWYIIYDGGEAAIFGNWETGDGWEYWRKDGQREYRAPDIERIKQHKQVQDQQQLSKADEAAAFIESCSCEGFSDYLKSKRIYPYGIRFDANVIIIPAQDATGKIWSYQRIYPDGSKYFMPGGRIKGCYHPIFPARNVSRDELVIVCEGYATGASIHHATGLPVIVAFNASNLKAVCDTIIFRNLLIAADNDESGVGEKAAQETGYPYVMPPIKGFDFNDMANDNKDIAPYFQPKQEADYQYIKVTGLVGEIADWITATAIRPQPELSLAAAISFMGMVKSRRVRSRYNLRTNWYSLALAPTGSGKDHPIYAISQLARATSLNDHLLGLPTSGTALLRGIEKASLAALLMVDEIGRFIGNINQKGSNAHMREVNDYIVQLFSAAGREFKGKQFADERINKQITFDQGHLNILGFSVSEKVQQACSSSEIADGFLGRWVLFSTETRAKKQKRNQNQEIPPALIEKLQAWLKEFPLKTDNYGAIEPVEMSFTQEALDIFQNYDDKMEAQIEKVKPPADKIYSRSAEHVEKLAMILADGNFIGIPEITQAIAIVDRSNRSLLRFINMIADNISEQDYIRVREIIKEAGEIKRSHLSMKCQFVQGGSKRLAEIVNVLLEANIISANTQGRLTTYKWIG